ncbi:MAG: L,D-transpeptidase family protein [Boseongicola sp. SB0662_bin_57]|nr:L,D-transpeptidase family protein [Boseongicola sp. SB0662_bin_57]
MMETRPFHLRHAVLGALCALCLMAGGAHPVLAQSGSSEFVEAVVKAAAGDRVIAEFYEATDYRPIWTDRSSKATQRRAAFLKAANDAPSHGLSADRYRPEILNINPRRVRSERDLGRLEVELTRLFLRYARDVQTGILVPDQVDEEIARQVPYRERAEILSDFARSSPHAFIRALPPSSREYAQLRKEKERLERLIGRRGWGPKVQAGLLKPGAEGAEVMQLRNRLVAMGYLGRNAGRTYDLRMQQAVAVFQFDHGLPVDGVAGPVTLREINAEPAKRLSQVMVAMERERWINMPLGDRHVWVNIPDFHVRLVDDGKVTFVTRSVVGARGDNRRTPEFSDVMEHLVINPTWYVPRSITVKEYFPRLKVDPTSVAHLTLFNSGGEVVERDSVEFAMFDEKTFPFELKQLPGESNALGVVKFMFPNRHNIYLHDTPHKQLFGEDVRSFSHGCIRLNEPVNFAYALLKRQVADPDVFIRERLETGEELVVELEEHVPVHLVYRTAFTLADGKIQFRPDIYGRDARIWEALKNAGVSLQDIRS